MTPKSIIFSSDIDGILSDYPDCFIRYLQVEHNLSYENKEAAKADLKANYRQYKDLYRNSNFKYQLPYNKDAIEFYKNLSQQNIPLFFSTSRPFSQYPHMFDKTKEWLKNSGIEFVDLIQKDIASFKQFKVTHHVDDEIKHAEKLSSFECPWNIFILHRNCETSNKIAPNFITVRSFDAIIENLLRRGH